MLKLAVVRVDDETEEVTVLFDVDLKTELARELAELDLRVVRKGRFGRVAAEAAARAVAVLEERLRQRTQTL